MSYEAIEPKIKKYDAIEPKIKNLVETFNRVGFETHASCQGHRMCLGNASAPYIAFRTDNQQKVRSFAKLMVDDRMLVRPKLFWSWKIEPCFKTRFFRNRIDKDLQAIENLLENLSYFQ
jgi:putative SOS response-associated peptidase YedK